MTVRSPVPPAGANWTEWHAARDAELIKMATGNARAQAFLEAYNLAHQVEEDWLGPGELEEFRSRLKHLSR